MTTVDNINEKKPIEYDPSKMTRAGYEKLLREQAESDSKPIKNQLLRDLRVLSESMHHEILRLKCLSGLIGNQNETELLGCTAEELSFTMDPIIERLESIQQVFSDFAYKKYETLIKQGK